MILVGALEEELEFFLGGGGHAPVSMPLDTLSLGPNSGLIHEWNNLYHLAIMPHCFKP